jgi:hypothetical protein
MTTSTHLWLKLADSTEWLRYPVDEYFLKQFTAANRWFKAADSTIWVFVSADPKPAKSEVKPLTPEQEEEINRIWAEYCRKRSHDAQNNIEREKDYTWDECVKSLEERSKKTSIT